MERDKRQKAGPSHMAPSSGGEGQPRHSRPARTDRSARINRPVLPTWLALPFVALMLGVMVAPLMLTPFRADEGSAEKRTLSSLPQLAEEGRPNLDFLSQLGDWYADHFALRAALVDLDATVKQGAFMTSATDNVVVGADGWLYYAGELNDWRRSVPMSDRAIANAAHNLALVQEVLSAQGKGFAVTIAPNKSTLYPAHMPPWLLKGSGPSNAERLGAALAERGVTYVNLFDALAAHGGDLYLARDSHWNNRGALVAAEALLGTLGRPHAAWEDEEPRLDATHVGDLDAMLHPISAAGELQPLWSGSLAFSWTSEETNVEASKLETTSSAEGALLMFRDSFGNALLPYMASSYGRSSFTKLVPYNMSASALRGADDVVIERTERHVSSFATQAPYLSAPARESVGHDRPQEQRGHVGVAVNGPFLQVRGEVDEGALPDGSSVLVELGFSDGSQSTFEAFLLSADADAGVDSEAAKVTSDPASAIVGDCGFCAFVSKEAMGGRTPTSVSVLSVRGDQAAAVIDTTIDVGGQL